MLVLDRGCHGTENCPRSRARDRHVGRRAGPAAVGDVVGEAGEVRRVTAERRGIHCLLKHGEGMRKRHLDDPSACGIGLLDGLDEWSK